MASVYSTRFFSVAGATGATGFLVPAGFRAVLRDVWVYVGSEPLPTEVILVSGTGAKMWVTTTSPLSPMFYFWQGRQVYEAGEFIQMFVTPGNADLSASGYLLTLP